MGTLSGKVLVVDDDVSFAALVCEVLAELGQESVRVRSAEDALRLCEEGPPRAAVIDGLLPGMRGDELARALRARFSPAELPIAFVSSFFRDRRSREQLVQQCGIDLVLHKPIAPDSLRDALGRLPGLRPAGGLPEPESLASSFGDLVLEYVAAAKTQLDVIESHATRLAADGPAELLDAVRTEAHRLRGSGTSFGFPEITRAATLLEDAILAHGLGGAVQPSLRARLPGLVEALTGAVARASGVAPIALPGDGRPTPRLLLVDGETELAAQVLAGRSAGASMFAATSAAEAVQAAATEPFDVVFVALDRPELDGPAVLAALAAAPRLLRVAIAGGQRVDRLELVRRGATAIVGRPPDLERLIRAARTVQPPERGALVAALDGATSSLGALADALAPHDVAIEPCETPEALFALLEHGAAQAALIDARMCDHGGVELVAAIRADPIHGRLPLLVVGDDLVGPERLALFAAGADDVLPRPCELAEAVARVRGVLARARRESEQRPVDPLTGLPRREVLLDALDRALRLSRRSGRPLAVLVVDADAARLRADHGRWAAEAAVTATAAHLCSSFRRTDLVVRLGEGRFAVLLLESGEEDSRRLLERAVASFATRPFVSGEDSFRVLLRAGLSSHPGPVSDATELLAHAESAVPLRLG